MRVTPEQSRRVQEICFKNNIIWATSGKEFQGFYEWIYIDENYMYCFSSIIDKEIDADLFIRTNGTCEESIGSKFQPSDKVIRSVAKVNGWDKLETSHYTMNMLLDKLKKKNEILKKARIKRKNQREELHKLNLKLQKCISLEEHRKVLNWHIERNESLFAEIDNLKAENKSLKESSKISCNMLHSQKDKIDRLELNYVAEQSNYKKEIEKLKAVIEYLWGKVK